MLWRDAHPDFYTPETTRSGSLIGFATIPSTDEGGLSIATVNRMIAAAVRGVAARRRRD